MKGEGKLLNTMKWALIALAFVPLFVDNMVFFPAASAKVLAIRLVVALVSVLFFALLVQSTSFGEMISGRLHTLKKNRLFLAVIAYFFAYCISAIFAANSFWAFWGNPGRGSGVIGMIFFTAFFLFAALLFDKKEYSWFYKSTLLVSLLFFVHISIQLTEGIKRPSSFTGNPIYLAAFFLFSLLAAGLVFFGERSRRSGWAIVSIVAAAASVIGIFMTESRGVILGLAAGCLAACAYAFIRGKGVMLGEYSLKKIAAWILGFVLVFGGIFISTRHATFWQHVPGLGRFTALSTDATTNSRLIADGISLSAMNPATVGIKRFIFGWGPDNYLVAFYAHIDPKLFFLDAGAFDRAHNQVFDVLVMNGLLGLLAYALMWFFVLTYIFSRKAFSAERLFLAFFTAAYFVQDLSAFDNPTTYIPFFLFLACAVSLADDQQPYETK